MPDSTGKPTYIYLIACLIAPGLGFIWLRASHAIGIFHCLIGLVVGVIFQWGILSVLGATNGDPLQPFVVYLLGVSLYALFAWQFWAGHIAQIWSEQAMRWWRFAGLSFGAIIVGGLTMAIALFHISRTVLH